MLIPARFNGPPGSGNGGYSAGIFANAAGARVGGPALQVTLRLPPPLDTPLTLDGGAVRAPDGALIADVGPAPEFRAPDTAPPVEYDEATKAAEGYLGFVRHPFPTCYVCGPDRGEGDGLRIFPGPTGDGRTAAPWRVPAGVELSTMWAALDCPGGWTVLDTGRVYVLGRIAAAVSALPTPGAACVVVGARLGIDGRKSHVVSGVYGADGTLFASAQATWIAIERSG